MTTVLVQVRNRMHMKYVFHNKFRITFHDQKTLSLNSKSRLSQIFFQIGVLKNFVMLIGKNMCCSFFLIELHAWRTAILLKRDSKAGSFL